MKRVSVAQDQDHNTRKVSVAHMYDGSVQVFETRGSDTEQVLRDAKKWIDEQDEVAPVYDL